VCPIRPESHPEPENPRDDATPGLVAGGDDFDDFDDFEDVDKISERLRLEDGEDYRPIPKFGDFRRRLRDLVEGAPEALGAEAPDLDPELVEIGIKRTNKALRKYLAMFRGFAAAHTSPFGGPEPAPLPDISESRSYLPAAESCCRADRTGLLGWLAGGLIGIAEASAAAVRALVLAFRGRAGDLTRTIRLLRLLAAAAFAGEGNAGRPGRPAGDPGPQVQTAGGWGGLYIPLR